MRGIRLLAGLGAIAVLIWLLTRPQAAPARNPHEPTPTGATAPVLLKGREQPPAVEARPVVPKRKVEPVRLFGRVVDEASGTPIAGAKLTGQRIRFSNEGWAPLTGDPNVLRVRWTAITDDDGRFDRGIYRSELDKQLWVSCVASGYDDQEREQIPPPAEVAEMEFSFRLRRKGKASLVVQGEDGKSVDAKVTMLYTGDRTIEEVLAGPKLHRVAIRLKPKNGRVEVTLPPKQQRALISVAAEGYPTKRIVLASGEQRRIVRLSRGVRVRGRLVIGSSTPVVGAQVRLRTVRGYSAGMAVSGADGTFTIAQCGEGGMRLLARSGAPLHVGRQRFEVGQQDVELGDVALQPFVLDPGIARTTVAGMTWIEVDERLAEATELPVDAVVMWEAGPSPLRVRGTPAVAPSILHPQHMSGHEPGITARALKGLLLGSLYVIPGSGLGPSGLADRPDAERSTKLQERYEALTR